MEKNEELVTQIDKHVSLIDENIKKLTEQKNIFIEAKIMLIMAMDMAGLPDSNIAAITKERLIRAKEMLKKHV